MNDRRMRYAATRFLRQYLVLSSEVLTLRLSFSLIYLPACGDFRVKEEGVINGNIGKELIDLFGWFR
jgi:hypothetical protein